MELKKHSTKYERRFRRQLKDLRIKFKTKSIIGGFEVDFLIGKNVIEIDGHIQNTNKNKVLIELGYNVFHFQNKEIGEESKQWLILNKLNLKLWEQPTYRG